MRLSSILYSNSFNPSMMGPIKHRLRSAKETLRLMPEKKAWYCGGHRSAAIAAELIRQKKVVALPTDTIYGLAGLAQSETAVARLYEIKERDMTKPLAICLCDVEDIDNWAHTEDLPKDMIHHLLPGPTTLILKRKPELNDTLNPGVPNVGIRIPAHNFMRSIVKLVNQPLALTSANKSRTRSSLHPNEFQDLWPELDGIFYEKLNMNNLKSAWRKGSTIVDLTVKGEFQILRKGIGYLKTLKTLHTFKLNERKKEKKPAVKSEEESDLSDVADSEKKVEAQASA